MYTATFHVFAIKDYKIGLPFTLACEQPRGSFSNIYILNVAALDETIIPSCLHFSMQNIEQSRGLGWPLGGVTSTNNFLCLSTIV